MNDSLPLILLLLLWLRIPEKECLSLSLCVCVCVCNRKKKRETERGPGYGSNRTTLQNMTWYHLYGNYYLLILILLPFLFLSFEYICPVLMSQFSPLKDAFSHPFLPLLKSGHNSRALVCLVVLNQCTLGSI